MALGVTFPKNEDVVAFERKNEMLVLLVSKSGTYKKELGNYAGYWLRKMYWKDLHCRGMQISRNALTHVSTCSAQIWKFWGLFQLVWHRSEGRQAGCLGIPQHHWTLSTTGFPCFFNTSRFEEDFFSEKTFKTSRTDCGWCAAGGAQCGEGPNLGQCRSTSPQILSLRHKHGNRKLHVISSN